MTIRTGEISGALLETLTSQGLTLQQATVYLMLLQMGPCGAGPLVKKTKLHRERVYRSLEALEERGLLTWSIVRNRKRFAAADPVVMLEQAAERHRRMLAGLPVLEEMGGITRSGIRLESLHGSDALYDHLLSFADIASSGSGSVLRIMGAAPETNIFAAIGRRYQSYLAQCSRLGLKKRVLLAELPGGPSKFFVEKSTKIRVSESLALSPFSTRITEAAVSLEFYQDEPFVIQMWGRKLAASYIRYFDKLWGEAKRDLPVGG